MCSTTGAVYYIKSNECSDIKKDGYIGTQASKLRARGVRYE